jgi:hypothetical protein
MNTAKKHKDYKKLYTKSEENADKEEIAKLQKKLIEELKNPEKAKKAALYIEHLLNDKK